MHLHLAALQRRNLHTVGLDTKEVALKIDNVSLAQSWVVNECLDISDLVVVQIQTHQIRQPR